jgi:hypothetical protein
MQAGETHCAMLSLLTFFRKPGSRWSGMCLARTGGTLNDAKIVRLSRARKRAYVGSGIGRGAAVEKSFVKCESFHRLTVRFVLDVQRNLAVPCVVAVQGCALTVDETVSTVFAIK